MIKRYIFLVLLLLQTDGVLFAFNPAKTLIGFYAKTCRPFTWYLSSFKLLEDDERNVIIDTLQMLEISLVKGLKWTDKGNIKATRLEAIPTLVYPYLLAKTWSKEKSTALLDDIINPLYIIAYTRFVCEYNLDFSLDAEEIIAKSGIPREQAVYRLCVIMLETVRSCLKWTGKKVEDKKELTLKVSLE